MNKRIGLLLAPVVSLVMLSLSGCASSGPTAQGMQHYEYDKEYVAAVERAARQQPVKVYWVNPPRPKPVDETEDGADPNSL
jgi:hypothetical protein